MFSSVSTYGVQTQETLFAPSRLKTRTMWRQALTKARAVLPNAGDHGYQEPFISWPKRIIIGSPQLAADWAAERR